MSDSAEIWCTVLLNRGAEFDFPGAATDDAPVKDLTARVEEALLSQSLLKVVLTTSLLTTKRAKVSLLKDACLDHLVVFFGDGAFVFAAAKVAPVVPTPLPMLLWIAEDLPRLLLPSAGLNFIERAKARASTSFGSVGGGGDGMFSDASKARQRPKPRSEHDFEDLGMVSHITRRIKGE